MHSYKSQYKAATAAAAQQGKQAEDAYLQRANSFDPYAAASASAQGQFQQFLPLLQRNIASLRGQQAGMGRLNTNWGSADEDRLVGDSLNNLNSQIAERSMQAAGMDMQNFQGLGQYGQNKSGMYYDLLSGAMDREQAEKNAKRGMWGGLLSAGLGAAGMVLGGPVGGAIGKWAGNRLVGRLP